MVALYDHGAMDECTQFVSPWLIRNLQMLREVDCRAAVFDIEIRNAAARLLQRASGPQKMSMPVCDDLISTRSDEGSDTASLASSLLAVDTTTTDTRSGVRHLSSDTAEEGDEPPPPKRQRVDVPQQQHHPFVLVHYLLARRRALLLQKINLLQHGSAVLKAEHQGLTAYALHRSDSTTTASTTSRRGTRLSQETPASSRPPRGTRANSLHHPGSGGGGGSEVSSVASDVSTRRRSAAVTATRTVPRSIARHHHHLKAPSYSIDEDEDADALSAVIELREGSSSRGRATTPTGLTTLSHVGSACRSSSSSTTTTTVVRPSPTPCPLPLVDPQDSNAITLSVPPGDRGSGMPTVALEHDPVGVTVFSASLLHRPPLAATVAPVAASESARLLSSQDNDSLLCAAAAPSATTTSTWAGACPACGRGENAFEGAENMVACDSCNNWFHFVCVGYTEERKQKTRRKKQSIEDDRWYCLECIQTGLVPAEDLQKMRQRP